VPIDGHLRHDPRRARDESETDATREADPEDLFGMSTAYMTMEADLGYDHCGEAALCFSGVDSTRFDDAVETVEAILEAGEIDTGTGFHRHEDDHGYQWFVLEDNDPEDLVTSIHFAADQFIEGFGSRLLAAVFGFERDGVDAYWIYSFRRGAYYPFSPRGTSDRNQSGRVLQSVLDGGARARGRRGVLVPPVARHAGESPVGVTR